MATKISTELLIMILNNVQSTQDLYSSLLVNRFWCKVTTPILWGLPLDQDLRWMHDTKLRKKTLYIRTYISCMDSQARTLLIQNGFDLSSSPPQATFDYPSFTHKLRIDNLVISIFSQKIKGSNQDNKTESRILFREICKLIINRCSFLDSFKMKTSGNFFNDPDPLNSDLIGSIFKLPGAPKVFKKLETFVSDTIKDELIRPLFMSLTLICDNILNMHLEFNSDSQMKLLGKLISVQKRLESLTIIGSGQRDCNSLLQIIVNQKETLKNLHLEVVHFSHFEGKSSQIGQFTSLQNLHIRDCHGLNRPDCLIFASSFTHLTSFHYFRPDYLSQEFIIKIFETANTNLKKISLYLYFTIPTGIFSAILNYCTKITELILQNLSSEQVIAIFNNNFNELRVFSFSFSVKEFDVYASELLCQMAENVPESLEEIHISMGMFSADSLRKFFEGWCCKGGGNKKMFVQSSFTLNEEHFKVIEEYGVRFYMNQKYCK